MVTQIALSQVWDVARVAVVRVLEGHKARVGTMAWGSYVLSSGSRDRTILQRDVRAPDAFTAKLTGHRSEVCGLKVGGGCVTVECMKVEFWVFCLLVVVGCVCSVLVHGCVAGCDGLCIAVNLS